MQILIEGAHTFVADITTPSNNSNGKLILFLHGFKSFKDWGCWPWLSTALAQEGFTVVKINFSHNGVGTTIDNLQEFTNLQKFGANTLSKELQDVKDAVAFIQKYKNEYFKQVNTTDITVIGHSRGGGMAIVAANQIEEITQVITLNAVVDFSMLWANADIEQWAQNPIFTYNGRTKQNMPLDYTLYQDYTTNYNLFNLKQQAAMLQKNWLIIHALTDETIPVDAAYTYRTINKNCILNTIPNTGHTFGATHPFTGSNMALEAVLASIVSFLNVDMEYMM